MRNGLLWDEKSLVLVGRTERDGDFGLTMDGNGGMNFLLLD